MTPADIAMRNAFDEGVQYARSPTKMATTATPLLARHPGYNLTTFELRSQNSSDIVERPATPHLTLHQFRKFQQSPFYSSSPDDDYKRVRRKQSFEHLAQPPFNSAPRLEPVTSLSHSVHSTSPQNFLPSLLPPLPLTPVPRPGTAAPSLSSTVDTLQSTPTHTPIQYAGTPFGQWRDFERVEPNEPIRTKRKFKQLKLAKRLPHHVAQHDGSGAVWQVHAAVVDIGAGERSLTDLREGASGSSGGFYQGGTREQPVWHSSGRKGKLVRFEGLDKKSSGGAAGVPGSETSRPSKGKEPTLTSSYSLSKFQFPVPPGHDWAGTLGEPCSRSHQLAH